MSNIKIFYLPYNLFYIIKNSIIYNHHHTDTIGTDTHFFKIGEFFKMDYLAVYQAAKRFEQKSEVNNEIKENMRIVFFSLLIF